MAKSWIIDSRISKLAEKWNVKLTPSLRFGRDYNIHKYYKLDGNLTNRLFFCDRATLLGYCFDDGKWTMSIHKAIFETTPNEAERLSRINELNESEALEFIIFKIVDDYNFNECFYKIDEIYSIKDDEYIKIYEEFETKGEMVRYLNNYIKNQIKQFVPNKYDNKDVEKAIKLINNVEWIFDVIGIKKHYSIFKLLRG